MNNFHCLELSINNRAFILRLAILFLKRSYLCSLLWKKKNCITDVGKISIVLVIENHSNVKNHSQKDFKSSLTFQHMGGPEIF